MLKFVEIFAHNCVCIDIRLATRFRTECRMGVCMRVQCVRRWVQWSAAGR